VDHCDGHVHRLFPTDKEDVHKKPPLVFWAFDNKSVKFISHTKPVAEQFDSSQAAATPVTSDSL